MFSVYKAEAKAERLFREYAGKHITIQLHQAYHGGFESSVGFVVSDWVESYASSVMLYSCTEFEGVKINRVMGSNL
jgi:hypothetical protein